MRSATGQPVAGTTMTSARVGSLGRAALAALAALIGVLALAATAGAAAPSYVKSFACSIATPCAGASETSMTSNYVAVDQSSGDVYVIDNAHDAVNRFDASGKYLSQLKGSETTAGTFEFVGVENDIAVDNSGGPRQGWVYVIGEKEGNGAGKLSAFDGSGTFRWQATPSPFGADPCGVAVDPSGTVWVGDWLRGISARSSADGTSTYTSPISGEICHIDFSSSGALYVQRWNGSVKRYPDAETDSATTVDAGENLDVSVDRVNGDAYTVHGADVAVYDSSNAAVSGTPFGNAATSYRGVTVDGAHGNVYVADTTNNEIELWQTAASLNPAPLVRTGAASNIGPHSADVAGMVDPNGAATTCEVQYSDDLTFSSSQPCSAPVGSGTSEVGVSANLTGLIANVTYNYRVVATNANGTVVGSAGTLTTLPSRKLTVNYAGTGGGTVTSSPSGISCSGTPCSADFADGEEVELTATPAAHSTFAGWSGCDSVTGEVCEVSLTSAKAVTATFTAITHTLTVTNAGSGSGAITCDGGPCASSYDEGATIVLAATPASGSSFAGFSGGGCSSSPCELTLEADTAVTATFNLNPTCATDSSLCPPPPPPPPPNGYGQCVAKANKAFKAAKKAAAKKHGKAKAKALKLAKKRHRKAIAVCKARYL